MHWHPTVNVVELDICAAARWLFLQQQRQLEALTAGLQKVSAQLELNRAAPKTVLNDN
jgi:hypothetical protein